MATIGTGTPARSLHREVTKEQTTPPDQESDFLWNSSSPQGDGVDLISGDRSPHHRPWSPSRKCSSSSLAAGNGNSNETTFLLQRLVALTESSLAIQREQAALQRQHYVAAFQVEPEKALPLALRRRSIRTASQFSIPSKQPSSVSIAIPPAQSHSSPPQTPATGGGGAVAGAAGGGGGHLLIPGIIRSMGTSPNSRNSEDRTPHGLDTSRHGSDDFQMYSAGRGNAEARSTSPPNGQHLPAAHVFNLSADMACTGDSMETEQSSFVWDLHAEAVTTELTWSPRTSKAQAEKELVLSTPTGHVWKPGRSGSSIQSPPKEGHSKEMLMKGMTMDSFGPSMLTKAFQRPPPNLDPTLLKAWYFLGMWPALAIETEQLWSWKRILYKVYRCCLVCTMLWSIAVNSYLATTHVLKNNSFGMSLEALKAVAGLVFVAEWLALTMEFTPDRVAMGLLHDVVFRGADLSSCGTSFKRYIISAVLYSIFMCYTTNGDMNSSSWACYEESMKADSEWQQALCKASYWSYTPASLVSIFTGWLTLWTIRTLCSLHVIELRWFADTVADTLQSGDTGTDVLVDLDIVETKITRRFINASQGWVLVVCGGVAALFVVWLLVITLLVSGSEAPAVEDLVVDITTLGFCAVAMLMSFLPFAKVAEVHEYDLLRTLNKPQVLHKAMPLFGQQMLPHLHTLEWGFKIGQTIINMRLVVNVFAAVAVSSITTIGAAFMGSMGNI